MAFVTYCNNKGCNKEQAPLLDVSTNEVLCSECDRPITTISSFAKNNLKSLGQTTDKAKVRQSFGVKCDSCNKEGQPIIEKDCLRCTYCSKPLTNISKTFENMLRTRAGRS
jgi:ribosomal protein L34E